MNQPANFTRMPRWLLGIDGLIALALAAFVATWAFHASGPFGPIVAVAVALCFPSAVLLGLVNGLALAPCRAVDDAEPPRRNA